MRLLVLSLLFTLLIAACKTPEVAKRLPGTWYIEHYDEYYPASDTRTGHDLDGPGYFTFSKRNKNSVSRRLSSGKPHGSLSPYSGYHWAVADSIITVTNPGGTVTEQWLIAKDMIDYLQLVSVNETRDTVRTMYVEK